MLCPPPPAAASGLVSHRARDWRDVADAQRLRYGVYVAEQGKRPLGVHDDRLADPLDATGSVWCARDGDVMVGTVTQTLIGPGFDVARLPAALDVGAFPRSAAHPLAYGGRFAIVPSHRRAWVLASLARATYAFGRARGARFAVMMTNPGLVPLFERLGYVRYTDAVVHAPDVGLLLPMVLPATDHAHLRAAGSACLPAAAGFVAEPVWGVWLRATYPAVVRHAPTERRVRATRALLGGLLPLPAAVAGALAAVSYVHPFRAGTALLRPGDRVTCAFHALTGRLVTADDDGPPRLTPARAPDGVALAATALRCATDASVLCIPLAAVARARARHPAHTGALDALVAATPSAVLRE